MTEENFDVEIVRKIKKNNFFLPRIINLFYNLQIENNYNDQVDEMENNHQKEEQNEFNYNKLYSVSIKVLYFHD